MQTKNGAKRLRRASLLGLEIELKLPIELPIEEDDFKPKPTLTFDINENANLLLGKVIRACPTFEARSIARFLN